MGKRTIQIAAMLAVTGLAGCPGPNASGYAPSAGALGISRDGALLYTANFDQGTVSVVRAASGDVLAQIPVGSNPARIAVGPNDRIYVTNRGSRTVSVIDRGSWRVAHTIDVGAEPIGVTVSSDGRTVFVASQESGEVQAFDTKSFALEWTASIPDHPRGVALAGGRLLVTHFQTGLVSFLDPSTGKPTSDPVNLDTDPSRMETVMGTSFDAEQATDVAVGPSGKHVYIPETQARDAAIATSSPDAYGGSPSAPLAVPVVASGFATLDVTTASRIPEPVLGTGMLGKLGEAKMPPSVLASNGSIVFNVPTAAIVDQTGSWLFATFQGSNNLAIISTTRRNDPSFVAPGVYAVVDTGGEAPDGVALSPDNTLAYVYNSQSYTISVIARSGSTSNPATRLTVTDTIKVADAPSWLTPTVRDGRRLFYSAVDHSITDTSLGGISCASCHAEGREDGRTWMFSEGPRNTPMLATGFLAQTKPFHWGGEIKSFHDFQEIVTGRMGGSGLQQAQFDEIMAFLESPAVLHPDNPNLAPDGKLTDLQKEGQAIFAGQGGCTKCHLGAFTTDNLNHDVGTFTEMTDPVTGTQVVDMRPDLQTPTLHDCYTTGPWLHNGAAATLTSRLVDFRDDAAGNEVHGFTKQLSDQQIQALVAYIKTL